MDLQLVNKKLRNKTPEDIVKWAINLAQKPLITTNFRPYEVAILHLVSSVKNDIDVVWCDTGYNTKQTYIHAENVIDLLDLKIDLYVPKQTVAYRTQILGIPDLDSPKHKEFTEQVKLEPFKRAMEYHKPDVWFTNLRIGQTTFRDGIDIVSVDKNGILKVSPFYHFTDNELDVYLEEYNLPNEFKYFDPTKVLGHRECGLHV
ncbi:phosphoadenosine phosphosulfate reductase family protein [Aurantibacter sp.]|uniref:phosphoadenosine phosphosulfate reductase domain-containing protein n=1 Tax=Aurantibacter sp. TaxID=2807103 RepID=UPI0035C7B487